MSALLFRAGEARHWDAAQVSALWSLMSMQPIIHGAQTEFDTSLLRFDASLLEKNVIRSILAKLPALHRSFKYPQTLEKYRFSFMAWMCTMSFASDVQIDQLQLIVMCAKLRQLTLIQAPSVASFHAQQGCLFKDSSIEDMVNQNLRTLHQSPEWSITRERNERRRDDESRRQYAWLRSKTTMVERTVHSLKSQWPCETPTNPRVMNVSAYMDIDSAMLRIKKEFNAWPWVAYLSTG
ncbi:hypothetical protein ACEQ8H_003654 [Pleosporales sp. CAS-2024a]